MNDELLDLVAECFAKNDWRPLEEWCYENLTDSWRIDRDEGLLH